MNQKACLIIIAFFPFIGCKIQINPNNSDKEAFNAAIKKASAGDTVFSDTITLNPFFRIKGQHIELSNIEFSNTTFRYPIVVLDSCSHSSINNCIFKNNTAMKQFNHMVSVSGNGSNNHIVNCTFDNIADGQLVSVRIGEKYPIKTLIAHNTFVNIPPNQFGNGAECAGWAGCCELWNCKT